MKNLCALMLVVLGGVTCAPQVGFAQQAGELVEGDSLLVQQTGEDEAAEAPARPAPLTLRYRVWGEHAGAPGYGSEVDDQAAIRQYFRGRVNLVGEQFELHAEADLLAGQLWGDEPAPVPARADTDTRATRDLFDTGRLVDPREFYAQWNTPVGQLRAGLQTSHWGLGIIANGGAAEQEGIFNQSFGGDRVLRAMFATAPLRPFIQGGVTDDIYLALGADLVWRDENADLLAGDRARQGMLAAFYRTKDVAGGVYAVYRDQEDADDAILRVWVFDGFVDYTFAPLDDFEFRAAGEVAMMRGESDRTWSQAAEPIKIYGLGMAAELEARYTPLELGLGLRAGWASGDADSDDDTLYRFRFDPNYHVGLVLFDYYLPAVSRQVVDNIFDPDRSARPPRGIDGLLNDGAVENALYLSPQIIYGGEEGLGAALSFLWAKADQPLVDLYETFANGGAPVGVRGRTPASDQLGVEFDAAARYRWRPVDELLLEIKAEYGIFLPGEAFADAQGNLAGAQSLGRARLSVLW